MNNKNILTENNVAEIAVTYSQRIPTKDRVSIFTSEKAVEVLRFVWDEGKIELQESFKIILLNRKCNVLGVATICNGGMIRAQVDLRILFAVALKSAAVSIILAHNHPSSNRQPSEHDKEVTRRILKCSKLLEIEVIDHIILTCDDFFSFKDEGLLEEICNSITHH
jgi:DNA repair protein RadC